MAKRPFGERWPWWVCAMIAMLAPAIVFGLMWYLSAGDDYVPLTRAPGPVSQPTDSAQ